MCCIGTEPDSRHLFKRDSRPGTTELTTSLKTGDVHILRARGGFESGNNSVRRRGEIR